MNIENNKLVMSDIESRRAFLFTLEWLLALLKRYKNSLQFGLVHIEFGTNHELAEAIGVQEAFKRLAMLTTSFSSTFRKTDIVARDAKDFWVIVPYVSDSEKIHDKILAIFDLEQHHDLNTVDREISIFSLPLVATTLDTTESGADAVPTTALEFLGYLKENRKRLASSVIKLSADNTAQ